MPNGSSLIRRLADLRRDYTGETDSSVLPAISHGGQLLDTDDRALLLKTLNHNWVTRVLGENSLPPLPHHIRHAVLPDATTNTQRALEARIGLAASRAVTHLLVRPPASVFRMVRPLPDSLVLHLTPHALGPLLLELTPTPGLSAFPHRRHVELVQTDADPVASVHLANVSYRHWTAAMAFVDAAHPAPKPDAPPPHTTPLASALLRRAALFSHAPWFTLWPTDDMTLQAEWPAGPSLPSTTAALLHPVFGLPGDTFQVRNITSDYFTIRTGDTTLALRHARPTTTIDTTEAWTQWEQVINAPNAVHVA
jgi:hypothetical protein